MVAPVGQVALAKRNDHTRLSGFDNKAAYNGYDPSGRCVPSAPAPGVSVIRWTET